MEELGAREAARKAGSLHCSHQLWGSELGSCCCRQRGGLFSPSLFIFFVRSGQGGRAAGGGEGG